MPDALLHVITSTDRRGAEVSATQIGTALSDRGWASETVALWPGPGMGLPVATLGARRRDPRAIPELRRRARRASLVIGHGSATLPFGAVASVGGRTRFVYRSIGDPAFWGSTRLRRLRIEAALRQASAVIAVWPGAADFFTRRYHVPAERVKVIGVGVPADRVAPTAPSDRSVAREALGLDPDRPTVLFLGALSLEKNPLAAVEAMTTLTDAQLIIGGDGPLAGAVAERARRLGPHRVHLAGSVPDPSPLFAAADVLVLPSRSEGVPAVAIEAGLAGLPVVAARVGGVAEVVVDGETGVLVDRPTPFNLAQALIAALDDASSLGATGRARVLQRFTLDRVADEWDVSLGQLVHGRGFS